MKANNVDSILAAMRRSGKIQDVKSKGNLGEEAALAVVHDYYLRRGGLLYHSYKYPYATDRSDKVYLGNIFRHEDGTFEDVTKQLVDEIDILYVSPFRIIPIEVKSYHAKIEVFDPWMKQNGKMVEKSPVAQAEKHARHLYHQLHKWLPFGQPQYIRPIVCFVDRCTLEDNRRASSQFYLPVCILNTLKQTLMDVDIPDTYTLDVDAIEKQLKEIQHISEEE